MKLLMLIFLKFILKNLIKLIIICMIKKKKIGFFVIEDSRNRDKKYIKIYLMELIEKIIKL